MATSLQFRDYAHWSFEELIDELITSNSKVEELKLVIEEKDEQINYLASQVNSLL